MNIGDKVQHQTEGVGTVVELSPHYWNGKRMLHPDSGIVVAIKGDGQRWWHTSNVTAYDTE